MYSHFYTKVLYSCFYMYLVNIFNNDKCDPQTNLAAQSFQVGCSVRNRYILKKTISKE